MLAATKALPHDRAPGPIADVPTAALALGGDYRALGVVRSLGRRGVPIWVLASGDDRIAAFSRYTAGTTEWPEEDDERLDLLERLAIRNQHRLALFPSSDEAAVFVARHHRTLAPTFSLTTPPWEVLRWAYDKRRTHELAVAAGVEQPWTICPRDRSDLERSDLRFPLVLKPAVKPVFNRFTAAKAWRADDRASLLQLYDEACTLVDPRVLMVQELIEGDGGAQLSYAALADSGRVLHSLVARRTRQYPADFGRASTFVETITDPGVEEPSRRLITASDFTGLLEIEYKVRSSDGRPLLLDINPRVWGWHTLCGRAGVDFPWLLWLRLQRIDTPACEARPGVRWLRISTDLPTAVKEIARGRMPVRQYVASLLSAHESAIFARDDIWPGLIELPLLARTLIRRIAWRKGI